MRQCVRFYLNGELVTVDGVASDTTLLDFLRETCARKGVKEGCAEGDCGACTVALGQLRGDRLDWQIINACIRLLATVDGAEIITVDGLAPRGGPLHPVQQAIVDHHGSQCGFCTPGFVMSLFGLYLDTDGGVGIDRAQVHEAFSGNLCRCTGYRPLIDAALSLAHEPAPQGPAQDVLEYRSVQRCDRLRALAQAEPLTLPGFHAPTQLDALAQAYADAPDSLVLAGGTDVGVWVTKQLRRLPPILYLGAIHALDRIEEHRDGLRIGAAVNLQRAFAAILAWYPHLAELAQRFASRPIRNSGTLCGNLANGSPIGDALPALLALDARLNLRQGTRQRQVALQDFYLGYQRKDLGAGEFVTSIDVPAPRAGAHHALYKVSKRIDQDISAVCAGLRIELDGGIVRVARIAYGGMAATARRAAAAEAALVGQPWSLTTVQAAMQALQTDFTPLSDMRASQDYRRTVAASLLHRFWLQTQNQSAWRVDGSTLPVVVPGVVNGVASA